MLTVGFIINPRAGLGGPLALKGSDYLPAKQRGSRCAERAERVLAGLEERRAELVFKVAPGALGEDLLRNRNFDYTVVGSLNDRQETSAADTRAAVVALQREGVDLILFAGGDGTARDIASVVAPEQVVLGIPAGVKMHSGVFAITPEAAAAVLLLLLDGQRVTVQDEAVRDMDETALAQGEIRIRHYGEMAVPAADELVQRVKEGGGEQDALVLEDIAAEVIELMAPQTLYLLGPGSTTRALKERLGIVPTLLGVDAVCDGEPVGADVDEVTILRLLTQHPQAAIVLTPIGGQGLLLGRGNQQLSPAVVRRVGRKGLIVVATQTKIDALAGRPLLVDSNDPLLDRELAGFIQVITGYRQRIFYPLSVSG